MGYFETTYNTGFYSPTNDILANLSSEYVKDASGWEVMGYYTVVGQMAIGSSIRAYCEARCVNPGAGYFYFAINGTQQGTTKTHNVTGTISYYTDLSFGYPAAGDYVQLWWNISGAPCQLCIKNFSLRGVESIFKGVGYPEG
jgi:hypothetical protein